MIAQLSTTALALAVWATLAVHPSTALNTVTSPFQHDKISKYSLFQVRGQTSNNSTSVPIANQQWIYTVEISIGNPPQKTLVQVDTGSSELWVNANCSSAPAELGQQAMCEKVPLYAPKKSNSSTGPFYSEEIGYGFNEGRIGAAVDYYKDTISVGGVEISEQIFGVASNTAKLPIGIMGLGPDLERGFSVNKSHPLLLDTMAEEKMIASRVFSVALGSADDEEGTLIFGGIDRGRYNGSLEKLPIVQGDEEGHTRLTVNLSSLAIHGKGQTRNYEISPFSVLLDTGYTMTKLNQNLTERIISDLSATLDKSLGYYVVDCSTRDIDGGVDFTFSNKTITVPFHEFIYTTDGMCAVGVQPIKEGEQQVLGVNVLRAAYVVFDWDNKNVHIAQAANCTSDIVRTTSGPDAVPSVAGNCPQEKSVEQQSAGLKEKSVGLATLFAFVGLFIF